MCSLRSFSFSTQPYILGFTPFCPNLNGNQINLTLLFQTLFLILSKSLQFPFHFLYLRPLYLLLSISRPLKLYAGTTTFYGGGAQNCCIQMEPLQWQGWSTEAKQSLTCIVHRILTQTILLFCIERPWLSSRALA